MKSYRTTRRESPISDWGHAMFADRAESLECYGGDAGYWFSVDSDKLESIEDLRQLIIDTRHDEGGLPWYMDDVADDDFFSAFAPSDIVMSAGVYDNEELLQWFFDYIAAPSDIRGIKTPDGAIVFDEAMIDSIPCPLD